MKRICLRCNVTTQDFNLWCQEKNCPAENATEVFDSGEWFGPIEIMQPMVAMRSAIIYQAKRGGKNILLKIANPGCEEKLQQEAKTFRALAKSRHHPHLPVLLAAHGQGSVDQDLFGWIVVGGQSRYYEVFEHLEGEILRNFLLKNTQPWYQHAGWIILSIADTVYYLHKAGCVHLCLNPDVILVQQDHRGVPRPILLDLGTSSPPQDAVRMWNDSYTLPAYTAPELLDPARKEPVGIAADVYGLGLLLYEMLAGRPAFQYHLVNEQVLTQHILAGEFKPSGRIDIKNMPEIAEKAIQRQPGQRYPDVASFVNALRPNFPPIPAERKPFRLNWRTALIILGALLAISVIILYGLSLLRR
jgi:serine/threonine protein kinase